MKQFSGFPSRTDYTPVPAIFFSLLLPQIDDIAELKTTLHLFRLLYPRKGYPRAVTYHELANDVSLLTSLRHGDEPPQGVLKEALAKAVSRGTILHLAFEQDGNREDVYFLNTRADREAVARIQSGEIRLPGSGAGSVVREILTQPQPNIYSLYEENIGRLTPMIAEELKDAEKSYPEPWLRDAIKEAVKANKRNWRYVASILERWATEGKQNGTYQRDIKKTDPDKYFKDKYGHLFQR